MKSFQLLKVLSPLVLVALVSGCANSFFGTNNKCHNPNWYQIGYDDGANGKNKKDLSRHYSDCGPNLVINNTAYDRGWKAGVVTYCNPRNGLKLGMEGKLYNNVCPDNQIGAFDKSWHEGIISYCTPANGYTRGLEGGNFPGFCPPYANVAFKKSYDRGHHVYLKLKVLKDKYTEFETTIQTLETDIKTREKTLDALQQAFAQEAFSPKKQYMIQKNKLRIKHLATQVDQLIQQREETLQKYNMLLKEARTHSYRNYGNPV